MSEQPEPRTEPAAATPEPPAAFAKEQVGVVLGDRICIRCGFNLHGQQIVREPHYQMLAVRCPECSALASLQQYPILGTWGQRFWMLLAVVWLLAVLLFAFLTGLTVYGTSESAAVATTAPAARQVAEAFAAYAGQHQVDDGSSPLYSSDQSGWWMGSTGDSWIDPQWVMDNNMREVASGARTRWRALAASAPALFGCFCWGVLWSVLLLQRRFGKRLILLCLIGVGSALVSLAGRIGEPGQEAAFDPFNMYYIGWGVPASTVGSQVFGLIPALVMTVLALAALLAGARWGRSIVRGLVRLLLPPYLRGSVAALWHVDGLPSPPTRHEMWIRG